MSAKIFFLVALVAAVNAGFIGTPAVVVPGYGRESTTVYHGSSLAYRAPLTYQTQHVYQAQGPAMTTAQSDKAGDSDPRQSVSTQAPSTSSSDEEAQRNSDFDSSSAFSFSYNRKDSESGRAQGQNERAENKDMEREGLRSNEEARFTSAELQTGSTPAPENPTPTFAAPADGKFVLVAAPALHHADPVAYQTPVTYHIPLNYHAPLTYHAPVTKVLSDPVAKFAYSTSQITYHPTPTSHLLEDCPGCPQ